MNYKILHISDLHFGPPFRPEVGEAVLQFAKQLQPDYIVVSGDLTQRAKAVQFQEAKQFLDKLHPKFAKIVVPGNHDIPLYRIFERLLNPFGLFRSILEMDPGDRVYEFERMKIVALNTTAPYRKISYGRLTKRQLDLCTDVFSKASSGDYKVLVMHHHLFSIAHLQKRSIPLFLKKFLSELSRLKVDMVLSGHAHKSYILNSLDLIPTSDRRCEHGVLVINSGTTTSRRGRGEEHQKNSLNTIDLAANEIKITHHVYMDQQGKFAPLSDHRFSRGVTG